MILREWSTLSGKRDSTPAKFVDSLLGRRLMKKGIVPLKERIQTFFTKGVCRPTGSYHEESCDITLLSTRWTTSTHCSASFCGSACLPLFTSCHHLLRPTRSLHLPLASQNPPSNSSTMRRQTSFFHSHLFKLCGTF